MMFMQAALEDAKRAKENKPCSSVSGWLKRTWVCSCSISGISRPSSLVTFLAACRVFFVLD